MKERLTEKQLLDATQRQGHAVSSDQLKRWRRAELIPRPEQTYVRGQRGSHATYPPGTLTLLIEVCELRRRYKKLDRIRLELWWAGHYHGELDHVRRSLIEEQERTLAPLREHRDRYDDPLDAAEAAVTEDLFTSRIPPLRTMRRLAKQDDDFRSAITAVFHDLFGGEPAWDVDDENGTLRVLTERALGVERAKTDLLEDGTTLLSQTADIVDTIRTLHDNGAVNLDDPGWVIRGASDDAIEQGRHTGRLIVRAIPQLAGLVGARYTRDHAGLSLFNVFDAPDPSIMSWVIQFVLLLPLLLDGDAEQRHAAEALAALQKNAPLFECAEMFLSEHPQYAFLVKPDGPKTLQTLPSEEREIISQTVETFLQKHPECAAALQAAK